MPNERGRIHEHKAPFRKQLSAQAFKVYSFVSLCERRFQNQHTVTSSSSSSSFSLMADRKPAFIGAYRHLAHGHCLGALFSSAQLTAFAVLLLAVIKQRCITAGALFWIGGELPVFVVRPHAPNREVRTVTVRYEYM